MSQYDASLELIDQLVQNRRPIIDQNIDKMHLAYTTALSTSCMYFDQSVCLQSNMIYNLLT